MLFASTVYTQAGPMIAKELDDKIQEIRQGYHRVDDQLKQNIINELEETKELIGTHKVMENIHHLVDDVSTLQAASLNASLEHQYHDAIVRKLDALVALENSAATSLRTRALHDVKAEVLESFKSNKAVKDAALNQAVAVLTAGPNAKLGKDVVGETFVNAFKTYREKYSKLPVGSDPIIANLEAEIAKTIQAPVLDAKGGNVYSTHPVSARYVA